MIEKPLKIGVFLFPEDSPKLGGGYSYVNQLVRAIDQYEFDAKLDFVFISPKTLEGNLNKKIYLLKSYQKGSLKGFILKTIRKLFRTVYLTNLLNRAFINKEIESLEQDYFVQQLKQWEIDLILYPKPAIYVKNTPYVIANWDVGHRTIYPFPEVAMNGAFEAREQFYRTTMAKAFMIITESPKGKQELINLYQIPPDRIKVLPLFPGPIVNMNMSRDEREKILSQISLKSPFFFYPAQFWAHKNHYNLIKAFALIEKKYPEYKLIFTGSDKGNLNYIKEVIKLYGLNDKVIYFGFVDESILYALYRTATALVMPTLLGPTNMPLLEAKALKCPVLCSDLEGHREIMGNYAEYFNPTSPLEIAEKMIEEIERPRLNSRELIIQKSNQIDIFLLEKIFINFISIRRIFK
jgi:glycosyltransferase involved in cell wall biosynthesis